VLFVSVNGRLYGGLTPYAAVPDPGATGARSLAGHLDRWPRLFGLWLDRDVGLVRWAPVLLLAAGALVLLARSRRERLAKVVPDQVHVEVVAGFLAIVAAVVVLVAVFLAPTIAGRWPPAHELVPALPMAAALSAWTLRRLPRTGRTLALLTIVATVWTVAGVRLGDGAGTAPPRGPLPWGGIEDVLPELR
jgi:hypothetical protein